MSSKKITAKLKESNVIKGIRDFGVSTAIVAGMPYVIPSVQKWINSENSGEKYQPEYKSQHIFVDSGVVSGICTDIAQACLYGYIAKEGTPEVLAIPALTNLASFIYEQNKEKIRNYFSERNKKKTLKKINKRNNKLEEKLSLKERIFGKKETTLQIIPQVTLSPNISVYVNDEKQKNIRVDIENNNPLEEQKDPLSEYLMNEEPFYISNNGEVDLFLRAYQNKLPVMLKGPTGCGKTRFIEHMAHKLKRPLITVNCQEDLSATDLVGRILLNEQGTYWQDGPLTKSARHGGICYLDEIIEARNDALVLIHSLTDHRRILPIDKTGEVIEAHPDFMLVVSYNPHYQSAIKDMKQSTRQRFVAMEFDYPEPDKEIEVIRKESGINQETAARLVNFGRKIRSMKGQGLTEGASTRLLTYAGKLIQSGIKPYEAIKTAIINPITDELDIQHSVMEVARTMF